MTSKGKPAAITARMILAPGSEIPGVPASEIKATFVPWAICPVNSAVLLASLTHGN